jgi:Protein of unknown function (DUF3105)
MARKDRAPTPPKRSQGPRQRAAQPRDDDSRRRLILYLAAGSGVVALVAVVATLAFAGGGGGGGSSSDPRQTLEAAGCTYQVTPAAKFGQHVTSLQAKVHYSTFPPASGKHYYIPAVWGFYTDPVLEIQAVHNLEHGGIIISWGNKVSQAEIKKIQRFYDESPDAMLAFPLPALGNKIALVSWTENPNEKRGQNRIAKCAAFDEAAFKAFRDAFRGKGPERFPVDQLTPGT